MLVLGLSGTALAAANVSDPAEMQALDSATVTAAEAIASAETASGGKVVELVLKHLTASRSIRCRSAPATAPS